MVLQDAGMAHSRPRGAPQTDETLRRRLTQAPGVIPAVNRRCVLRTRRNANPKPGDRGSTTSAVALLPALRLYNQPRRQKKRTIPNRMANMSPRMIQNASWLASPGKLTFIPNTLA